MLARTLTTPTTPNKLTTFTTHTTHTKSGATHMIQTLPYNPFTHLGRHDDGVEVGLSDGRAEGIIDGDDVECDARLDRVEESPHPILPFLAVGSTVQKVQRFNGKTSGGKRVSMALSTTSYLRFILSITRKYNSKLTLSITLRL